MIDIITPVAAPREEFLSQCWASLDEQSEFKWLLQWQSDNEQWYQEVPRWLRDLSQEDARVEIDCWVGAKGAGIQRNLALNRGKNQYLLPLDYDDLLLPGALASLLKPLEEDADLQYSMGLINDLVYEHGEWVSKEWPLDLKVGMQDPQGLRGQYEINYPADGIIPEPPPGMRLFRRPLVVALGGWGALPLLEDTWLTDCISQFFSGYLIGKEVGYYRKHSGQYLEVNSKERRAIDLQFKDLLKERIDTLRQLFGQ